MLTCHDVAAKVMCPEHIETNQSLKKKIDGWGSFLDTSNNTHYLNRVTFYAEHPSMNASLAPDNEHTKKQVLTWSFDKDKIWLACGYTNTNIRLIKKLPDTIKTCSVTYRANFTEVCAINCI